jgi:hypothetical protein
MPWAYPLERWFLAFVGVGEDDEQFRLELRQKAYEWLKSDTGQDFGFDDWKWYHWLKEKSLILVCPKRIWRSG